ncbi:MAG: response regulator [Syntrophobacteraceae bacterium]
MKTKPLRIFHLLMADDDGDDCLLAREAFEEAKIPGDISFVGDGRELMEYLQTGVECPSPEAALPDLLLLDLNMPRKDGREALREMKSDSRLKSIPVVIFSTAKEEKDIRLCRDNGALGFIMKPVIFEKWVDAFRLVIQQLEY